MSHILFISHRMPYPPDKGDKIRSHQITTILRELGHRVSLAFILDDPVDEKHLDMLRRECDYVVFSKMDTWSQNFNLAKGIFSNTPLTLLNSYSKELQEQIKKLHEKVKFDFIYYYSGASLNYYDQLGNAVTIIDYVDVDSQKWKSYAKESFFPLSKIYKDESQQLGELEKEYAEKCDLTLFVSKDEAEFFCTEYNIVPSVAKKVKYLNNSVDIDFFSPHHECPNPFDGLFTTKNICVMTGVMNYRPNADAAIYFATKILPKLNEHYGEEIGFCIVGRHPTKQVMALNKLKNVFVTGGVPDVRPYILHSTACVSPLLIARGVQNKVLEAMACGKAVVASRGAFTGIDARPAIDILVCDTIEDWVIHLTEVFKNQQLRTRLGDNARLVVCEKYAPSLMPEAIKTLLNEAYENKFGRKY